LPLDEAGVEEVPSSSLKNETLNPRKLFTTILLLPPSTHCSAVAQVFERVCRDHMPPYGLQLRSNKPTTMFRRG
jgi:hypothetical protein